MMVRTTHPTRAFMGRDVDKTLPASPPKSQPPTLLFPITITMTMQAAIEDFKAAMTGPVIVSVLLLIWAIGSIRYIWWRVLSHQGIPNTLPWAGAHHGATIERAKASLRSFLGLRMILLHGYRDVWRLPIPFDDGDLQICDGSTRRKDDPSSSPTWSTATR